MQKKKKLSCSATQKVPHIYGNRDVIYVIHGGPIVSHMKQNRAPSSSVSNIIPKSTHRYSKRFPSLGFPATNFIHSFLSNVSTRPAPPCFVIWPSCSFVEDFKIFRLYNFLHPLVTFSLSDPNISLSTHFPRTLILGSYLNVTPLSCKSVKIIR